MPYFLCANKDIIIIIIMTTVPGSHRYRSWLLSLATIATVPDYRP